jgi:hypothetical protein
VLLRVEYPSRPSGTSLKENRINAAMVGPINYSLRFGWVEEAGAYHFRHSGMRHLAQAGNP